MAVLYFKNGVDRYWRKNAPNEISPDEKEFIRQSLTTKFDEPVNHLAIQISVLIAKIARYDCPREWVNLVPTLLEVIRGNDSLAQHRALLTFYHVVKTLASKKLATDRQLFQELSSNVFNFILNLWNTNTESFFILVSNGAMGNSIQEALEKAHLSLKILGKLIVNGFHRPSDNQDAMLFLKVIFERAKTSLECRKTLINRNLQIDICDKFIIHLTKILLSVIENHPFCFIDLIPSSLEFVVFYCFNDSGREQTFERFIIQCLNLLKNILQGGDYRPTKIGDDSNYPLTMKANQMKQEFFTHEIFCEIYLIARVLYLWNDCRPRA